MQPNVIRNTRRVVVPHDGVLFNLQVKNVSAFWNWTEHRLIPSLYNATWYNGKHFEYEEGFISNRESYLVGMPRLRQLRIKEGKKKKK